MSIEVQYTQKPDFVKWSAAKAEYLLEALGGGKPPDRACAAILAPSDLRQVIDREEETV